MSDLSGFNGAVTLPATHGGQARAFTMRRTMATKEVSRYGGNRFERHRGGTIRIEGDVDFFIQKGTANSTPNIIDPAPDGAALALQFEIGCTLSGTAIFPTLGVNHAFTDPAIQGTHGYLFTGTVLETWATTGG